MTGMGRPSRNLGNIFNSQLNRLNMSSRILPSRTIPFTVIRDTVTRVDSERVKVQTIGKALLDRVKKVPKIPRSNV